MERRDGNARATASDLVWGPDLNRFVVAALAGELRRIGHARVKADEGAGAPATPPRCGRPAREPACRQPL